MDDTIVTQDPIVTANEVEQVQPEQSLEQVVAAPVVEEQPVKETQNSRNFRALKAETARIAKERDEANALLRQYELEKKSRQLQVPVEEDNDFDLAPDALAEGKHLKKISKELKEVRRDLEQARNESRNMATRAALIAEHPDYERIVNAENLKALELTYPHLARAINMNDPYNAGKACYDLIKQFGIDQEEVEKTEVTKALIKQNLNKPKPAVAVMGTKQAQTSPMGRASEFYEGDLTDEMKKVFFKEMQDAMNSGRR